MRGAGKEVKIRPARLDEMTALTELSMRSKQSNGYDDAFMEACRDELTVTQARMDAGTYWVAEAKGAIRGCVALGIDDGGTSGEINAFFIDPDWQKRGIGRMLWQRILEQARAAGLVRLHLASDPSAVPFYEKLGFVTIGEIPSGSIEGRALPHMTRIVEP